jgi:3-mercaptopyruvate sulfurtransferase SseA
MDKLILDVQPAPTNMVNKTLPDMKLSVRSGSIAQTFGHDRVRFLNGGLEAWESVVLNTNEKPGIRPKIDYIPELRPKIFAAFDFVVNRGVQVVDARSPESFRLSSIP